MPPGSSSQNLENRSSAHESPSGTSNLPNDFWKFHKHENSGRKLNGKAPNIHKPRRKHNN